MPSPAASRRLACLARVPLIALAALIAVLLGASVAQAAEPAYPRSLGLYLHHGTLPSAADLARYDTIVIDNEFQHRDPNKFAQIRALNPNIKILAYVNFIDRPLSLGSQSAWQNRWDLWGYTSPNSIGTFPERWIAKTASGGTVSEWAGTWMTNLSDTAPPVNGQRFYEYAANWVADNVWSSGKWDGLFLDVWGDRIWNSAAQSWDIDRDGDNETGTALYQLNSPWERGITAAENIMRAEMPGAIIVANNTRTFKNQKIDGRLWESFADPGKSRNFNFDVQDYVNGVNNAGHRQPGVQLTLDKDFTTSNSSTDQRRARYFLTATLLSNGYWGGSIGDYSGFGWHEEFHGAGLGRGYLGQPIAAKPTWSQINATYSTSAGVGKYSNGLYRRDFSNGIAITNPTDAKQTVTLETTFKRLNGRSSVNTGANVTTIEIQPKDGIILMRNGVVIPPDPDPDPDPDPVTISLSPTTASLQTGQSRQFSASASASGAISWSVNGVAGGNSTVGTISSTGLYTAPASVPSGGSVTVRATHASGPSASASVTISAAPVDPPPSTIPAPMISVPLGNLIPNARFTSGLSNWSTWQATATTATAADGSTVALVTRSAGSAFVLGDNGFNLGTRTAGTRYRAEAWVRAANTQSVGKTSYVWLREIGNQDVKGERVLLSSAWQKTSVEFTATGSAKTDVRVDLQAAASGDAMHVAMISVVPVSSTPPAPVTVSLSPESASVQAAATRQFTASASASGAITWSVNGVAGGNSTVGTISSAGLYTAPAAVPSGGSVTITATHASGSSDTATVTITSPPPPNGSTIPAPGVSAPFGNLVPNARFTSGLTRWSSWQGSASIVAASDGSSVALVSRSSGSAFTLGDNGQNLGVRSSGSRFRAEAWVRAANSGSIGERAYVWLREEGTQDIKSAPIYLSNSWQKATVDFTATGRFRTDVRVSFEGAASGDAMHIAMISVVPMSGSAPIATPIAEPAPMADPVPVAPSEPAPAPAPPSSSRPDPIGKAPIALPPTSGPKSALPSSPRKLMTPASLQRTRAMATSSIDLVAWLRAELAGRGETYKAPKRSTQSPRLTRAQAVANQRLTLSALRQVNALQMRLTGKPGPRITFKVSPATAMTPAGMRATHTASLSALKRAKALVALAQRQSAG